VPDVLGQQRGTQEQEVPADAERKGAEHGGEDTAQHVLADNFSCLHQGHPFSPVLGFAS